jgi:hypothetical protein
VNSGTPEGFKYIYHLLIDFKIKMNGIGGVMINQLEIKK